MPPPQSRAVEPGNRRSRAGLPVLTALVPARDQYVHARTR